MHKASEQGEPRFVPKVTFKQCLKIKKSKDVNFLCQFHFFTDFSGYDSLGLFSFRELN